MNKAAIIFAALFIFRCILYYLKLIKCCTKLYLYYKIDLYKVYKYIIKWSDLNGYSNSSYDFSQTIYSVYQSSST